MPKFDTIKEGEIYYDCHKTRMGNTTISRMAFWDVKILTIDRESRTAVVSWNGNKPTTYSEKNIEKLRRSRPKPKN